MHYREHNAEFASEFQKDPEQCNRIGASGNGDPETVSGTKEVVLTNVSQHRFGKLMHGSMVTRAGKPCLDGICTRMCGKGHAFMRAELGGEGHLYSVSAR